MTDTFILGCMFATLTGILLLIPALDSRMGRIGFGLFAVAFSLFELSGNGERAGFLIPALGILFVPTRRNTVS